MFDFENKPIKDWTLAKCKEYCNNRRNKYDTYCFDNNCLLRIYNICGYEPRNYKISPPILQFKPDEIAFCRLIKETYPWAEYIVRGESGGLRIFENDAVANDSFYEKPNAKSAILNDSFFPQIKHLTYYAIDDIIKQGESNNA